MKTKMTLSVDPDIKREVQEFLKIRGQKISSVVENFFIKIIEEKSKNER